MKNENDKVYKHFKKGLEFHPIKYAGQSEKEDWHLVGIEGGMSILIDQDGDVRCYGKHYYIDNKLYKYADGYFLLAGELYSNYIGKDLQKVKSYSNYFGDCIKDMFYYEETGLLELLLDYYSVFMYQGKLLHAGGGTFFKLNKYALKKVCWKNGVMQLDTMGGGYYMSLQKKRIYSAKSQSGKKLEKIFYESVE